MARWFEVGDGVNPPWYYWLIILGLLGALLSIFWLEGKWKERQYQKWLEEMRRKGRL